MTKRKAVRRVGNRRAWAVRFLLVALSAFLFLKAVQLHGQISANELKAAELEDAIRKQEALNEEDNNRLDSDALKESHQQEAYENGYARPGEQIFVV